MAGLIGFQEGSFILPIIICQDYMLCFRYRQQKRGDAISTWLLAILMISIYLLENTLFHCLHIS